LSKPPPPLLGFNNNVKHRGRVFHIQTEDSGVKWSRIVTHLFADGGRIIRTVRTDYSEHLGRDDQMEVLRRIMKEQHKAMFIRLRAGELDDEIAAAFGVQPDEARLRVPPVPASTPEPAVAVLQQVPSQVEPLPRPRERRLSNPALRRVRPSIPPLPGDLDLDVASLDQHPPGAPPDADPRRVAALARTHPPPAVAPAPERMPSEAPGRYAQSRPAAIFGELPTARASIFGQNMVTEKSLDEVILSYLADEIDEGSSPK
jgi:hypothetical protein